MLTITLFNMPCELNTLDDKTTKIITVLKSKNIKKIKGNSIY